MHSILGNLPTIPTWAEALPNVDSIALHLRHASRILNITHGGGNGIAIWNTDLLVHAPTFIEATMATVLESVVVQVLLLRLSLPFIRLLVRPKPFLDLHWIVRRTATYVVDVALVWMLLPHLGANGSSSGSTARHASLAMSQAIELAFLALFSVWPVVWLSLWVLCPPSMLKVIHSVVVCARSLVFRPVLAVIRSVVSIVELGFKVLDPTPGKVNIPPWLLLTISPFPFAAPLESSEEKESIKRTQRKAKKHSVRYGKTRKMTTSPRDKKILILRHGRPEMDARMVALRTRILSLRFEKACLDATNGAQRSETDELCARNNALVSENASLQSVVSGLHLSLEAFIAERNKLRLDITTLKSDYDALQDDYSRLCHEMMALRNNPATLQAKNGALASEEDALCSDVTILRTANETLTEDATKLQTDVITLHRGNAKLQEDVNTLHSDKKALADKVAELTSLVLSLELKNSTLSEANLQSHNSVTVLTSEKGALISGNTELKFRVDNVTSENAELVLANEKLRTELSVSADELKTLQTRLTLAQSYNSIVGAAHERLQAEHDASCEAVKTLNATCDDLRSERIKLQSSVATSQAASHALRSKCAELESQVESVDTEHRHLQATCNDLQFQLASSQTQVRTAQAHSAHLQSILEVVESEREDLRAELGFSEARRRSLRRRQEDILQRLTRAQAQVAQLHASAILSASSGTMSREAKFELSGTQPCGTAIQVDLHGPVELELSLNFSQLGDGEEFAAFVSADHSNKVLGGATEGSYTPAFVRSHMTSGEYHSPGTPSLVRDDSMRRCEPSVLFTPNGPGPGHVAVIHNEKLLEECDYAALNGSSLEYVDADHSLVGIKCCPPGEAPPVRDTAYSLLFEEDSPFQPERCSSPVFGCTGTQLHSGVPGKLFYA